MTSEENLIAEVEAEEARPGRLLLSGFTEDDQDEGEAEEKEEKE